ncbi:hypothetical protein Back2_22710 [Nocardioides baekrokdamisoli]|uniref:Uncharacterized protein n=1 Tax=Nocardioides baekrokdamisoli TaxID=1804624 RepID=A0A3G9J3I4_9ACTN|nr:hypothetical protein [Nocardioides baekrokdamisoli]BBH17984.1 hypothetical protein Back2_22710 [Nocardioides baekrokdamisoli]
MKPLIAGLAALTALSGCGAVADRGAPAPTPSPAHRSVHRGAPQVTLRDPTLAARVWQVTSAVTRPGGVVVIGIDDIALTTADHRAIPGTLALARESVAWGRSVLYLTVNPDAGGIRQDLVRAGYPKGELWTPATAPWCGRHISDGAFRAACISYEARKRDVILWLTRGQQLPTPADRTYAFAG